MSLLEASQLKLWTACTGRVVLSHQRSRHWKEEKMVLRKCHAPSLSPPRGPPHRLDDGGHTPSPLTHLQRVWVERKGFPLVRGRASLAALEVPSFIEMQAHDIGRRLPQTEQEMKRLHKCFQPQKVGACTWDRWSA